MDDHTEVAVIDGEEIDMETGEVRGSMAIVQRREAVGGLIRPVAQPSEVLEAQEDVRKLVEGALKPKRDYDTIPGTKKPTLLKPGAERINAAFGCAAQYRVMEREIDHDRVNHYVKRSWEWGEKRGEKIWTEEPGESQGLYRYVISCQLVHRESGVVIGEGVGSCSTMESKYIDRPRDLENTVLKMAKKRAFIDATLTTFGLSEQFTQDVEDMNLGGDSGPFTLDSTITFGKHDGKTWAEVIECDRGYVHWAIEKMDKLSDEARDALKAALKGNGDAPAADAGGPEKEPSNEIACPKCGGEMWDNRESKQSSRSPDLKCKDKECDTAIWLSSWRDDLIRDLGGLHAEGKLTAKGLEKCTAEAASLNPARMLTLHRWIQEKAAEVPA